MDLTRIVTEIDAQIAKLQQARTTRRSGDSTRCRCGDNKGEAWPSKGQRNKGSG